MLEWCEGVRGVVPDGVVGKEEGLGESTLMLGLSSKAELEGVCIVSNDESEGDGEAA